MHANLQSVERVSLATAYYEGFFRVEAGTRGATHYSRAHLYPAASLDHAAMSSRWVRAALELPFQPDPEPRGQARPTRATCYWNHVPIAEIAVWPRLSSIHRRASELNEAVFSMTFHSILFPSAEDRPPSEALAPPDFFVDLNLDQIVAAITAGKAEYNLAPFFCWPLRDVDAVHYRHEVMRDLEDVVLFDNIKTFATALQVDARDPQRARKASLQASERGFVSRRRRRLLRRDRLPDARFGRREPALARPPVLP